MRIDSGMSELQVSVQMNCQYPGQTMMVALAIMLSYPSLIEAKQKGVTFSEASENSAIPGAGCAVQLALKKLSEGVLEEKSSASMVEEFTSAWRDYAGGQSSYSKDVEPGLTKASLFEDEFIQRWDSWKAASQVH